jgi:hypothetical protein
LLPTQIRPLQNHRTRVFGLGEQRRVAEHAGFQCGTRQLRRKRACEDLYYTVAPEREQASPDSRLYASLIEFTAETGLALGSATSIDVDSGNGAHMWQFISMGGTQRRDALTAAAGRMG